MKKPCREKNFSVVLKYFPYLYNSRFSTVWFSAVSYFRFLSSFRCVAFVLKICSFYTEQNYSITKLYVNPIIRLLILS